MIATARERNGTSHRPCQLRVDPKGRRLAPNRLQGNRPASWMRSTPGLRAAARNLRPTFFGYKVWSILCTLTLSKMTLAALPLMAPPFVCV